LGSWPISAAWCVGWTWVKCGTVLLPFTMLAAPATVSPTSATEQKQHQKNNQYGFHVVT
jgi:hypothetical protein